MFPSVKSFVVKVNPSLSFGVSEIRRTFHLHLFGFFVCLIVFETKRTTEINYLLITKKRGISGIYKYLLRPIFKRIYPLVCFLFFCLSGSFIRTERNYRGEELTCITGK